MRLIRQRALTHAGGARGHGFNHKTTFQQSYRENKAKGRGLKIHEEFVSLFISARRHEVN